MSAPNADKPGDGILDKVANSATNAVNYVSESLQSGAKEASAQGNKETFKGNTDATLTDRAKAGVNYLGDKSDKKGHDASAEANKQSI